VDIEYTSSRFGVQRPTSFNPARDLFFQNLIKFELGMLGMMNYSAASIDRFHQRPVNSPTTNFYRSKLMSRLKARIASGDDPTGEDVLIAVGGASAAITEVRYGIYTAADLSELQSHLRGLYALLQVYGGWPAVFSRGGTAAWFLSW
jgi:hypothetical protein